MHVTTGRPRLLIAGRVLGPGAPRWAGPSVVRVCHGLILAVERWRGHAPDEDVDVVDLRDRTLQPGFIDAHNHQPSAARDRLTVSTAHARCLADVIAAVSSEAARCPPGTWIATERSLTRAQLAERRFPTARELDEATTRHPVAVRFGAHAMVVNSAGLEASGLAQLHEDPSGGWLERDTAGRPSGALHEYGALRWVEERLSRPSTQRLRGALAEIHPEYLRAGITTVRVPGVRPGELGWYQQLDEEDPAPRPRVFAAVRVEPNLRQAEKLALLDGWPVRTGFGGERLRVDALKIFVDGGVDSPGEPVQQPMFLDRGELTELTLEATRRGWAVTCHAVTCSAVSVTLDAYERVRRSGGPRARLCIEHALFTTRQELRRAAELDVWLSVQPSLVELNAHVLDELEDEEHALVCRIRSAVELGASVALGSDWNATPGTTTRPFAPRRTLAAATAAGPESISAQLALRLHTRAAGQLVGHPSLGSLAPGAPADLVAFAGLVDPEDLPAVDGDPPTDVMIGGRFAVRDGRQFDG